MSGVATAYNLPFNGSSGDNVYLPGDDRELFNIADQYECSPEYYDLMGIKFLEGRAPRDSSEIVVDEKFVTKMAEFTDWSDGAVGKQVFITGHDRSRDAERSYFTISGVYKSYLIGNLTGVDPRPSALFYGEIGSMSSWMPHRTVLWRNWLDEFLDAAYLLQGKAGSVAEGSSGSGAGLGRA